MARATRPAARPSRSRRRSTAPRARSGSRGSRAAARAASPRRATTKPVDQMRTKTQGIARTSPRGARSWSHGLSGRGREFPAAPSAGSRPSTRWSGPRRLRSGRCPRMGVDQPEQRAVIEQERDRDHLHDRLHLAEHVHGDAARRADLRHPFAQRRDRDLAADDHERDQGVQAARWTSTSSAAQTRNLSATGSRKAPNDEVMRAAAPASRRPSR